MSRLVNFSCLKLFNLHLPIISQVKFQCAMLTGRQDGQSEIAEEIVSLWKIRSLNFINF